MFANDVRRMKPKFLSAKSFFYSAAFTGMCALASTQASPPDPQMQAVLDELAALDGKPTLSATEARKQPTPTDAVLQLMKKQDKKGPQPVGDVDDIKIELSNGKLDARVYTPEGEGPFPVILYIHGGGWVMGNLDVYDATPRALCVATKAVVISTHYRQAPEYKFPAAHEDVYGAYQWVLANGGRFNGTTKMVAVVGESAGANMAASLCEMAKAGNVPLPVHQVLIYPVANYSADTPSYIENARAKPLNAAMMKWFFNQYLSAPEDGNNTKISLLKSEKLGGLPPATIITAELDPLRSEGEALARKFEAAQVPVAYKNYEGVTHEFFGMGAVLDKAQDAVAFVAVNLRMAFQETAAKLEAK